MLVKRIPYKGVFIEVYQYGNKCYYYPSFNGNYEVDISGYRRLCSYIKTVLYFETQLSKILNLDL